ncbi:hypothetical protein P9112_012327 [Eukaryota sp. TZLM1-RC]
MFNILHVLLAYCVISFASEVHLVIPDTENQVFYWTSDSTWNCSYPTESSTVFVDGKGMNPIIVIDVPPNVHSIHLSDVTLRLESHVVITGITLLDGVIIESVTEQLINFTTTDLEVLKPCEFYLINFILKGNGKLASQLATSQSIFLVDDGAELVTEGGRSSLFDLQAWGNGGHGRTGTGNTDNSHSLLPVITDEVFTFVSGGYHHSLGLTSEGTLFAWGRNNNGQLGLGSESEFYDFPQPVDLNNVVQISAGFSFSLARTEDNFAYSWGTGGRLGHEGTENELEPRRIESLENVIDVSAGDRHGLVVLSGGTVKSFGSNWAGKLGIGSSFGIESRPTPHDVVITQTVRKVIGCEEHSLFITEDDQLMAAGLNNMGQLCMGDESYWENDVFIDTNRYQPEKISKYVDYTVIQASCGQYYTIFLTKEGDVYSCGDHLGRTTDSIPRHTPGKVQGLGRVRSIHSGYRIAFAIDFNNVLFSWEGDDVEASLNAETKDYNVANLYTGQYHFFVNSLLPSIQSTDESLLVIDGTFNHDLAFTFNLNILVEVQSHGSLICSGQGVLFNQTLTNFGLITARDDAELIFNRNLSLLSGSFVSGLPITILAGINISGYGVFDSTLINYGIVIATGEFIINYDFVLHDSSQVLFGQPLSNLRVPSLSVNGNITLLNTHLGSDLYSFGFVEVFDMYLLGKTELTNVNFTVLNLGTISDQLTVKKSVFLVNEKAFLTIDGQGATTDELQAWGNGGHGRTATGNTDNSHSLLPVITDEVFTFVSGGYHHSLGLTSEGTLFAWGRNNNGQLGLGSESEFYDFPQPVDLNNVVQISAGFSFSLARTEDNFAYSWGYGWGGRLGHDDSENELEPRRIESLENVIDVSAGYAHSLAVISGGKAVAWGPNGNGELGDGSATQRDIPVEVATTESIKKAIGCVWFSLFITDNDELMTTGRNNRGQLCLGNQHDETSPVKILNYDQYTVIQASCGLRFMIFLTKEGDVYSCGDHLGRTTDSIPHHTPGKVQGLGRIRKVISSESIAFAIDFNNVLFSWEGDDVEASLNAETKDYNVANLFTGGDHFFIYPSPPTLSAHNSILILNGTVENIAESLFSFEIDILVNPTGSLLATNGGYRFENRVSNAGLIKAINDLKLIFEGDLNLEEGQFSSELFIENLEGNSITGFGNFKTGLINHGVIEPFGIIEIIGNLELGESSTILFTNQKSDNGQLIIDGTVYLDGSLTVDYSFQSVKNDFALDLITFYHKENEFSKILVICESFIEVNADLFQLTTVNEIIPDLNHISFISPFGTNEDCCGTASVPCLSLSKIIERMGYFGVVYFEEGEYNGVNFDVDLIGVDFEFRGNSDDFISVSVLTSLSVTHSYLNISNIEFHVSGSTHFLAIEESHLKLENLVINTNIQILVGLSSNVTFINVQVTSNNLNEPFIDLHHCKFIGSNSILLGSGISWSFNHSVIQMNNFLIEGQAFPLNNVLFAENSEMELTDIRISVVQSDVGKSDLSIFFTTNSSMTISALSVVNSALNLMEAVTSEVIFYSLNISNCQCSLFFNTTSSSFELNNVVVNNSIGQFIVAQDSSEVGFRNVAFEKVVSDTFLIEVCDSKFDSIDFVVFDSDLKSLFSSLQSNSELITTKLTNLTLFSGNLLHIDESYLEVTDLQMIGYLFDGISNVFTCNQQNYLINSINTTFTISHSNLIFCLVGTTLYSELVFIDSTASFLNLFEHLALTHLLLTNSSVEFNTNHSVLAGLMELDEESSISGKDKYLHLELMVGGLSTINDCIGTKEWEIGFNFTFAELMEEFVVIDEFNSVSKIVFSASNYTLLRLENIYALNRYVDYFELHFSAPTIQFSHKQLLQLCPPKLSLPPIPTQGKELLLNGTNLGHVSLVVSSSTINFIIPDSPITHETITVIVPPGAGCHDVEVKRSLDSIVVFTTFCFESPVLFYVESDPFAFQSSLFFKGQNFFDNIDLIEVSFHNATLLYSIISANHTELILEIHNICDFSSTNSLFVIVAGLFSVSYRFSVKFPSYIPSSQSLNPMDDVLSLNIQQDLSIHTLSQCNDIEVVGNVPLNWTIAGPTNFDLNFDLVGVDSLQLLVQLSKNFVYLIEVPVVDFYVLPPDYVCIINQICIIKVCLIFDTVVLHDYFPLGDGNILIVDYEFSEPSCMVVMLVIRDESNNAGLKLCSKSLCNTLQDLPKVVTIDSLSPSLVQWEYQTTDVLLTLTGENFNFYDYQQWQKSFSFDGKSMDFSIEGPNLITFTFEFTARSSKLLQFIGFGSVVELFTINCDDFFVIVPFYFPDSELIVYSRYTQSFLQLLYGNDFLKIYAGENSLTTHNGAKFITFYTRTVSEMIDLDHVMEFIALNVAYNFSISFPYSSPNVEINSLSSCSVEFFITSNQLELEVLGSKLEFCVLELVVSYYESKVTKELIFQIVEPPKLEFLGDNYFKKSHIFTFSVVIEVGFRSFDDFYLSIGDNHLDYDISSFGKFSEVYSQTIEASLFPSDLKLSSPVSFVDLELVSNLFGSMLLTELQIFDVELFSESIISIFQPGNVVIETNTELKPPVYCIIEGQSFGVMIDGFDLICKNVIIATYKEFLKVSIYYFDLEIGSVELTSEPFFVDLCFVPDQISLIDYSVLVINNESLIHLFDKTRCCLVTAGNCYSIFKAGEEFTIQFTETYQIYAFSFTVNSSCSNFLQRSPISLGNFTIDLWHCESLLNGFDDALMCSIEVDFNNVGSVTFDVIEDLLLFEVEVYGYKTSKCLRPIDDFVGATPLGDFVFIKGYYEFAGERFEVFDSIYSLLDDTLLTQVVTEPFTVVYSFSSPDCYYSTSMLSTLISPQEPQSVILANELIIMKSNSFILSLQCRDSNNIMVNCFDFNHTNLVKFTSFSYNHYYINALNSIQFDIHSIYPGSYFIQLGIGDNSRLNFSLFQEFKKELIVNILEINQCNRLNLFFSSCVLFTLEITLNTQDLLVNYTQSLSLYEVDLAHDSMVTHFVSSFNELEVTGLPLSEIEILFSYQSTFASIEPTLNDCDSTRINLNNECHCKPGTVLGSVGECEPCPLGYYLDNPLLGQCINCPITKVTKSIGSSNISDCVCSKSEFGVGVNCLKCPKFGTCEYGELTTVSNGYKFNPETGSISCPYKYSCRNNQCRLNTKGIDCTECIEGTRRYGFVCIGTSGFGYLVGFVSNLALVFLLFASEYYLKFAITFYHKVFRQFNIPSLSLNVSRLLTQYKAQIVCPLRVLMVLSILINGNVVLITLPFSLSASLFGNRFGFLELIACFVFIHLFCRKILNHSFSFKDSYYSHFCLFTGLIGIYSKLIDLRLDVEVFLLFGICIYCFFMIPKTESYNDRFRSLSASCFLALFIHSPYTILLITQTIVFLVLIFHSGKQNAVVSYIGSFYSSVLVVQHVVHS